jgi:capsular exopolysaccharide synthesis family protein
MITSAAMDEGKSVTAANLAAVLAESGQRVILVDGDLHRPSQGTRFGVQNRSGFSTLLANPSVKLPSILRDTSVPGLRLLTAGPSPAVASSLLTSRRFDSRLAELCDNCDVVIIDTPPVLAKPDAALLAPHMDGVLLVVDAQRSRGRQVRRALEMLAEAGATVDGIALNRVSEKAMDYVQYLAYTPEPTPQSQKSGASSKISAAARGGAT